MKTLPTKQVQENRKQGAVLGMAECIVDQIDGSEGSTVYHDCLIAHADGGDWADMDREGRTDLLLNAVLRELAHRGLLSADGHKVESRA